MDGVTSIMNRFRYVRFVLLAILFVVQGLCRVYGQSSDKPKRPAIGIITSYFGTHPQLQRAALKAAEEISKSLSNADSIDVVPFELTAGEATVWQSAESKFTFQQVPMSPKPEGHDNEAAVRFLAKKYDSFVLISNGPSVAPPGKLSGGGMPKTIWQRRLPVTGASSELLIIGSESVPQTIVDSLTVNVAPPSSQQPVRKASKNNSTSSGRSEGPILIIGLAMVAIFASQIMVHINMVSLRTRLEKLSKRTQDGNLALSGLMYDLAQENAKVRTTAQANNDVLSQIVTAMDSDTHSSDPVTTNTTVHNQELGLAIAEINRISESMKPVIELQEKSFGAISDMLVSENAKLKQSLAESRADIKRFDETVLTYAKLLFRLSTDPLNDAAVRQNSEYVLGRLKRYFERAGVDVILPAIGEELQDELHSVVGTEPADEQFGHMAIVSIDELGIRRGENVIEKAKVIVAVEESK